MAALGEDEREGLMEYLKQWIISMCDIQWFKRSSIRPCLCNHQWAHLTYSIKAPYVNANSKNPVYFKNKYYFTKDMQIILMTGFNEKNGANVLLTSERIKSHNKFYYSKTIQGWCHSPNEFVWIVY